MEKDTRHLTPSVEREVRTKRKINCCDRAARTRSSRLRRLEGSAFATISRNDRKKGEVYGYDGGKKVKGRKRHIVVDSQGLIVGALVTEGNTPERLGAAMVILEHQEELSDTEVIWVDGGYSGQNFARVVRQICGASVEVVKRTSKTFKILPKRWMVERTFGWLNRYRRLSKDYETHVENSEAMIYGSLIRLMIRRFAL